MSIVAKCVRYRRVCLVALLERRHVPAGRDFLQLHVRSRLHGPALWNRWDVSYIWYRLKFAFFKRIKLFDLPATCWYFFTFLRFLWFFIIDHGEQLYQDTRIQPSSIPNFHHVWQTTLNFYFILNESSNIIYTCLVKGGNY